MKQILLMIVVMALVGGCGVGAKKCSFTPNCGMTLEDGPAQCHACSRTDATSFRDVHKDCQGVAGF